MLFYQIDSLPFVCIVLPNNANISVKTDGYVEHVKTVTYSKC